MNHHLWSISIDIHRYPSLNPPAGKYPYPPDPCGAACLDVGVSWMRLEGLWQAGDEGSAKKYPKTYLELNVKSCVWKIDLVVDLAMIWHIFWHDICRFYNDVVGWRGVSAIGSWRQPILLAWHLRFRLLLWQTTWADRRVAAQCCDMLWPDMVIYGPDLDDLDVASGNSECWDGYYNFNHCNTAAVSSWAPAEWQLQLKYHFARTFKIIQHSILLDFPFCDVGPIWVLLSILFPKVATRRCTPPPRLSAGRRRGTTSQSQRMQRQNILCWKNPKPSCTEGWWRMKDGTPISWYCCKSYRPTFVQVSIVGFRLLKIHTPSWMLDQICLCVYVCLRVGFRRYACGNVMYIDINKYMEKKKYIYI